MATTNLDIILKARDDASKVIEGAAASIKSSFKEAEAASNQAAFGLLAFGAATAGAIGYGAKIAGDLESARQGFVTLLGSTQAADDAINRVKRDAAATPFNLPGLITMNQQLTGLTHDSAQSEGILMDFGKAMAAMGKSGDDLTGVMEQVRQVMNKGKLEMQDVKPIESYIDLYGVMSRNLGISREKLMEMQTAGTLTSSMLLEAFHKAATGSGEFANAYINQAGTFNQLLSNTTDILGITAAEVVKDTGIFDALKQGMAQFIDYLTNHEQDIVAFVKGGLGWIKDNGPLIAGIITGMLLPAVVGFVASFAPLIPFVAVGAALGLAIQLLVQHFGGLNAIMTNLQPVITASVNLFAQWRPVIQQVGAVVGGLFVDAFKQLWSVIATQLWPALVQLEPLWKALGIVLAVVVVGALAAAIVSLLAIINFITTLLSGISTAITVFVAFGQAVQRVATGIWQSVTNVFTTIRQGASDLGKSVSDAFMAIYQGAVDAFTRARDTAISAITAIWIFVKPVFDLMVNAWNLQMAIVLYVFAVIRGLAIVTWGFIWQNAVKPVFDAIAAGITWVGGVVIGVWNWILAIAIPVWATIRQITLQAWSDIVGVWNGAVGFFNGVWSAILNIARPVWNEVHNLASAAWNGIAGAWNGAVGFFAGIFNAIGNGANGIGASIGRVIGGAVEVAKGGIKSALNWIIDRINDFLGGLNNTAGRLPGVPQISMLRHMATGGPVTAGTPYIVGERGEELFVPQQSGTIIPAGQTQNLLSGAGGGTNIHIGTVINNTKADWSSFSRDIGFQLALHT